MTSIELLKILTKQWANINDIQKIANCGRDRASNIRNYIINEIRGNGFNLPNSKFKIVPMCNVIKYLNLDIEHIALMAQKQKLI